MKIDQAIDKAIKDNLDTKLQELEKHFESDVVFYYGEIHPSYEKIFRDFIEDLKANPANTKNRLSIILNTPGGSAETVEKMVEITRFHYNEVWFIVPDYAMSAGTIFCMSGDKIYMDYTSSLGPIDPQVWNGTTYVPALGYLDKVNEMIEKSKNGTLTQAEFLVLQSQDIAMLRRYEQARDLTIQLLKDWLVKYKFKNWDEHRSNISKKGQPVTIEEKELRAAQIAEMLSDNKIWHSHGRFIGIGTLKSLLRLDIEDYSDNSIRKNLIRSYNDIICDYIVKTGQKLFLHSRNFF